MTISYAALLVDERTLGGALDVRECGRRVVRYQTVTFQVMRLLGGWLAKIPEYELKLEIGRHVWQDAQAAEALRVRTAELRVPADADRRPAAGGAALARRAGPGDTPLEFLVGVYRVVKPRLVSAMQYHVAVTDPVCDAPTLRTLQPIVAELRDQISWGNAAIEALSASEPTARSAAAAWQSDLEGRLAGGRRPGGRRHSAATSPDTLGAAAEHPRCRGRALGTPACRGARRALLHRHVAPRAARRRRPARAARARGCCSPRGAEPARAQPNQSSNPARVSAGAAPPGATGPARRALRHGRAGRRRRSACHRPATTGRRRRAA